MRDRRIRGAAGRGPDPPRGARPPGVPRLRLGGHRRVHALRAEGAQGERPGRRPRRGPPGALQGLPRHRAHALGHPRRAHRRERPPAGRRGAAHRRRPQRHHRERRRAARQAQRRRRRVHLADRHRDRRAPGREGVRRRRHRPGAGRAAGAALGRRRLRAGHHGRRAPRPHRRRPQRQPRAAGHRREGDVRRLRRRRADRLHPPGRLPRRRRARHHHRGRLPHLHDRRPLDGQEPVHDRLGRRRRRDRRPRALPHQGDRRAAAHDRARVLRPHRRALRHRPARRPQPHRPRGPRDQAREDPRLRLGLLRGRPRRAAHRGPRPHARHVGGGLGVPLPQPGGRAGHALHRGQPVAARRSTPSPRCRSCSARAAG